MPFYSRCKQEKASEEFNIRTQGHLKSACRACRSAYHKDYYEQNKARYLEKAKKRNAEMRAIVRAYVDAAKNVPCADCGVRYPSYVMQFDHIDAATKLFNVGDLARSNNWGLKKIKEEIEKGEVVCANCHCERTHRRRLNVKEKEVSDGTGIE